ncbi:MAG TPA: immunoglobulin domain-containing protein [Candidatus Paceibacterota bacterium]|nr:immunoglobulin domain-containing protein [Verrucomicrobiota bacterium]HSA11762.1 immunoglobulin domain-containing protein [Candidatus Paceibacterota bacterium]
MKKTFALLVLIITPVIASAQGTVSLANQTGLVKQWTSLTDPTLISVPKSGGYVQLLAAPQGTPLPSPLAWQPDPDGTFVPNCTSLAAFLAANPGWAAATNSSGAVPVLIAVGPGLFSGGTFTIGNIAPGAPANYLLIGWTGSYTSFDAALDAALYGGPGSPFLGVSAVTTTTTGNPLSTPAGTPVNLRTTFAGMTLAPVVGASGPWFPVGPPPNQQVTLGDTATFTAVVQSTPPATFQWSFNGTNIAGATSTSYTITNAQYADAGTYTLLATNPFTHWTASASPVLEVLPPTYPLNLTTPGGGSVTADGQILAQPTFFPTGSVVTLQAVPSNGWSFVHWQGDASGTNNPLGLTMNNSNQVQGIFGTAVGTNVLGRGSIALSQTNPVPFGTVLAADAQPAAGRYFIVWNGAASGTNNPTTLLVTNPAPTVRALFSTVPPDRYPLSVVMISNHAALVLTGVVGNVREISFSPELAATNLWTSLTNLTLQHPIQIWTDTSVDALTRSHHYYRVVPVP